MRDYKTTKPNKKNNKKMTREEYLYHNTEMLLKKYRDVVWSIDVAPVIIDGRTLVPVRAIFEALDTTVTWDDYTRTAHAKGRGKIIAITIDKMTFTKNNENVALDVPAQIINKRTFVPARAIAEALDCKVDWDGSTRTVIITD